MNLPFYVFKNYQTVIFISNIACFSKIRNNIVQAEPKPVTIYMR